MKTRVISGAVFVAIVTGFFLLRQFVDARIFNILLWLFSAVGAFEMARASREITGSAVYYCSVVFGVLLVPVFVVCQLLELQRSYLIAVLVIIVGLVCNLAILSQQRKEIRTARAFRYSVLNALYPSTFILFMLLINAFAGDKGFVAMLLLFVIAPFADTFAYFVGSMLKGPKLCPKLSPKKTWSGAIGGLVGGAVGSIVVFFIFGKGLGANYTWYLFLILGAVVSIITIIGDLFESFIKRRIGIKDMGKIMPGHGGVLDRIDGMSFAAIVLYIVFAIF